MKLEVSSKRLNYKIDIYGKYTIITGNSGSGKTTLFNMVMDCSIGNKAIKIYCDKKVVALANNFTGTELEHYTECVIIIDEYNLLLKRKDAASIFKNSNNYFIIITRKILDYLPVSIDNYLMLENENKLNKAKQIYPRFKQNIFDGIYHIVTEDSASGLEFFKEYFPDIKKSSAHSKSEISEYLKNNFNSLNGILIVYDASAFAFSAKELFEVTKGYNVSIFDWESYENFVLRNAPFYEEYNQSDMDCYIESLEQFSEKRLSQLTSYKKGNLLKCIRKDCNCGQCNNVTECKYKHGQLHYNLFINNYNVKE